METEQTPDPAPSPRRSARIAMAAVLGLVLVSAGWLMFARRNQAAQAPAAAPATTPAPPAGAQPASGTVSATLEGVVLSAGARIQAEKFKCICGCNLLLAECTCKKTPGSVDMKQHLQALVDRKLPPEEIERGMVEKYGTGVLP